MIGAKHESNYYRCRKDKTGIVAGVSTKIAELGLNIDDISQTVLEEYFTMMALVSSDEKQDLQPFAMSLKLSAKSSTSKSTFKAQPFLMPCTISKE